MQTIFLLFLEVLLSEIGTDPGPGVGSHNSERMRPTPILLINYSFLNLTNKLIYFFDSLSDKPILNGDFEFQL